MMPHDSNDNSWRRKLQATIEWDALRAWRLHVPNAWAVVVCATAVGVFVIELYRHAPVLGAWVQHLFAKEGPFEDVTFVLELVGAALCFWAAARWSAGERGTRLMIKGLYAALGLMLFTVGMEEINWGQTLFNFATPEAWSQINYQHETSLHNLVDKSVLTRTWRLVAVLFALGVLGIVALSVRFPQSVAGAIAPPPSLVPLALFTSYAGVRVHPEMIELLMSVFFAFYSYRIWIAARATPAPSGTGAARRHGRVLRYLVAAVLITILLYRVDWAQAAQQASRLSLPTVGSAFVAVVIGLVISAWKWDSALKLHDLRYPYPFLLRTLGIGFFLNNFLPTAVGGDAYRIVRTLPREGYRSRALSAVILERGVGLLALLVLGGIGALRLADRYDFARTYCYVLAIATVAGIAMLIALEGGWLERFADRWRRIPGVDAVRHNLGLLRNRRGGWLGLIIGSLAFQLVSVGVIFLLFNALSVNAAPSQCALIAAAVGLAAALPISINGVGVMEGALVAAAVALKLDYETALLVAFARRVLAVCVAVPCGLLWIAEARSLQLAQNRGGFVGLLQAFWREGFRGLLQAVPPPSPAAAAVLEEPDVPLAAPVTRDEPNWLHPQLLEFTHDAIIIWEMGGQGIVYWNRAAEQLYGFSRAEAHSQVTHELLRTELTGGVSHLEAKLARYGIWVGELRHTARDGRHVYVDSRLALLSQQNGKWLVLEVNRDITDRKAAEAERNAVERQLAEWHVLRGASR